MKTSIYRITWVLALIIISYSLSVSAQQTRRTPAATTTAPAPAAATAPAATTTQTNAQPAEQTPSEIGGWRVDDYVPYITSLKDLEKLSKDYGEKVLQQSMDEYSKGMDLLHDMEAEIENAKRRFAKKNNLQEQWYWQEIDRQNQEKRQILRIKYEAKIKAVTYFTRAINSMDNIENVELLESEQMIEYRTKLYQAYVSTQYDIQNLKPCIPVLERYIAINETTKKDKWAYKYLASCYGYMETTLVKYDSSISEELIVEYKQKKNSALLTAAELEYGIDSVEYRSLKEVVELDEKKSERINDYR